MNYKQLVMKFLRENDFVSADWNEFENLVCYELDGDPYCSDDDGFSEGTVLKWLELEIKLRNARCKPFTVDIDIVDNEEDWSDE